MNDTPVRITVQHFNGCPHWLDTVERIERVVDADGIAAEVRLQLVNSQHAAEALNFRGSPTVLVNGVDPFADPDSPMGLLCRVYTTPDGLAGSPTASQLSEAIAAALTR